MTRSEVKAPTSAIVRAPVVRVTAELLADPAALGRLVEIVLGESPAGIVILSRWDRPDPE